MRLPTLYWPHSLTVTLLLLSPFDLLASLAMDMYLPVVPHMQTALGASESTLQLTLTLYLVLLGAGQLLFGPLSDHLGRRPVLLSGGVVFSLSSAGIALTTSTDWLLILRVVQACGASACLVATFATVRDIYAGRPESHVVYGLMGSMLALVPAIGPLAGAIIDTLFGWRAIFGLLSGWMLLAVLLAGRYWPETRQPRNNAVTWQHGLRPLRHLHFWLYTCGYSAGMGCFFVFFSTAPWVLIERHGLSQLHFSVWFASVAVVMAITAKCMGKVIPRWGKLKTLCIAMGCIIAGALMLALGERLQPNEVAGFIVPMWVVAVGIAAAVSVAPNGALAGFDAIAGTATAVYFCLGSLLLGLVGTFATALLPVNTAWPVVGSGLFFAAVVLTLASIQRLISRHHQDGE
ncbi:chloramphenicol efflux MFS transporter [Enterobacterales bacterium CwR94]|nr:chloramphenicol efflux MFS transporter [Enterobacterales bacterium CwR94]